MLDGGSFPRVIRRHQPLEVGEGMNHSLDLGLGRSSWQQVTLIFHMTMKHSLHNIQIVQDTIQPELSFFFEFLYTMMCPISVVGGKSSFVLPSTQSLVRARYCANST